jgi:hypothetical protein
LTNFPIIAFYIDKNYLAILGLYMIKESVLPITLETF